MALRVIGFSSNPEKGETPLELTKLASRSHDFSKAGWRVEWKQTQSTWIESFALAARSGWRRSRPIVVLNRDPYQLAGPIRNGR